MRIIRGVYTKRIIKIYILGFVFDLDKLRKVFIKGFKTNLNRKHKAKRKKVMKSSLQSVKGRKRVRKQLLERDGECCNYCKVTGVPLQVDHIIPLNITGKDGDILENKQFLCEKCHKNKTKKEHPKLSP